VWKSVPVFSPNNGFVLGFEIFLAILILAYFFVIPIYVAFGNGFFSVWG
jgi:hypothetical protein